MARSTKDSQHIEECLEMGYGEDVIQEAIHTLSDEGQNEPTLEKLIDLIEEILERKNEQSSSATESLLEENRRLRSIVYCMKCHTNTVNALFLPCAHLELCMTCANPLEICPVCQRGIKEKVRTYMA